MTLTPGDTTLLQVGVKPWKLRIDWTCHHAYGDQVDVELHVMDDEPTMLRRFPSVPKAIDWAMGFFAGRGFGYWCDVDMHQRLNHKHITLHPTPLPAHGGAAAVC